MSSDNDLFEEGENPTSQIQYGYLIFFHWAVDGSNHFRIYENHLFSDTEVRDTWILNTLSSKFRKRTLLPISLFKDEKMSLFAKIESCKLLKIWYKTYFLFCGNDLNIYVGATADRRTKVVDDLNAKLCELLKKMGIDDAYASMVAYYPYRVLESYSFDWDEVIDFI